MAGPDRPIGAEPTEAEYEALNARKASVYVPFEMPNAVELEYEDDADGEGEPEAGSGDDGEQ